MPSRVNNSYGVPRIQNNNKIDHEKPCSFNISKFRPKKPLRKIRIDPENQIYGHVNEINIIHLYCIYINYDKLVGHFHILFMNFFEFNKKMEKLWNLHVGLPEIIIIVC